MLIKKWIGTRLGITVVLSAVAAIALAIVVAADIPNNNGVFHGCYKNNNGQLRLVDRASDCANNETHVRWNRDGQQGDPGPQGPQGNTGATGAQGPAGPSGPAGAGRLIASGAVRDDLVGPPPNHFYGVCDGSASGPSLSLPFTLTERSIVNVHGSVRPYVSGGSGVEYAPAARVRLIINGSYAGAYRKGGSVWWSPDSSTSLDKSSTSVFSGPLVQDYQETPGTISPIRQRVFVVPPGSHVLELILTNEIAALNCNALIFAHYDMTMAFEAFSQ